ncbi:MAG: Gfo/Idh/MocA family oxidoreductase, partial [Acidobacteria bacterium]|nr:Gfo/Idh/MocA family oxidoreductase [Acidobacteriota bacterium]
THIKALLQVADAELVAVASDDPVRLTGDLSGVQGNIGGPGEKYDFSAMNRYLNWEEAVLDPEAEVVDICLPTDLHAPAAIAALRAGKHVLLEKPMALTGEDADAVLATAKETGKLVMTAQVLRFFPAYVPLADLVHQNSLGTIRSAIFRRRCAAPAWSGWSADSSRSGGGVFDLLIHDVDMCLYLFGKPTAVSAWGYEDLAGGVDFITAQLHYADIASVTVTGGWHHPKAYPFSMEYTVVADGGTVEYSSAGRPPMLYTAQGDSRALETPETDGYQAEVAYFLDCVRNQRAPEKCSPEDSAAAVKLTRLMVEARTRNGERIECNL